MGKNSSGRAAFKLRENIRIIRELVKNADSSVLPSKAPERSQGAWADAIQGQPHPGETWRVDLEGQMKIIQLCKEVGVILAVVLGQSQS